MRIARGRTVLAANSARVRNLSLAGALKLLKPPASSKARPGKKTTAPPDLDLLAWSGAPLDQRRHFLDGVGLSALLEALPPEWRLQLADRVLKHASPDQLIERLEDRLGDKYRGKCRAALKDLRKAFNPSREITLTAVRAA
jgi:hypothetical protein